MQLRFLLPGIALYASIASSVVYNETAHKAKCADLAKIAKEAVAYSLLGAWDPYANHKCFAKESFQFFKPSAAQPEGDLLDPSKLIRFAKGKDKYVIDGVKKAGEEYEIKVNFEIAGKKLTTTYIYTPDPPYTGRTGICGFVNNTTHHIVRNDCIDEKVRNEMIKQIKK